MVSRLAWRGDTCVIESRTRRMGMTIRVADRWWLSADAARLTLDRDISAMLGKRHMKIVFARDSASR
jgi:hypothetical protein